MLKGDAETVTEYLHYLVDDGMDPILVSLTGAGIDSDTKMKVLEPEREERAIQTDSLLLLQRSLTRHLRRGERKAVVIDGLQAFRDSNDFRDLTNFIGRLYEEACVNKGVVLIFADPVGFTAQELAFLERETGVLEDPAELFDLRGSETVK